MKLVDKKIETVMDPVFLLDKNDYLKIATNKVNIKNYILVYYLAEDEKLSIYAQKIQKILNIPIIEIHFFDIEPNGNIQLSNCGPNEFIELFSKSSFVVTNSFHGTAFSIILKKDFYAVYDTDCRKDHLLHMLNLENRHVYSKEIVEDEICINYGNMDMCLEENICFSKEYINRVLE